LRTRPRENARPYARQRSTREGVYYGAVSGAGCSQSGRWRAAAWRTPDKPSRSRGSRRQPAAGLRRRAPGRRIDTARSCRQPALQGPEQRCGRGPPDGRTGEPSDHTRHPVQVGEEGGGRDLPGGNRNGGSCPAANTLGAGALSRPTGPSRTLFPGEPHFSRRAGLTRSAVSERTGSFAFKITITYPGALSSRVRAGAVSKSAVRACCTAKYASSTPGVSPRRGEGAFRDALRPSVERCNPLNTKS